METSSSTDPTQKPTVAPPSKYSKACCTWNNLKALAKAAGIKANLPRSIIEMCLLEKDATGRYSKKEYACISRRTPPLPLEAYRKIQGEAMWVGIKANLPLGLLRQLLISHKEGKTIADEYKPLPRSPSIGMEGLEKLHAEGRACFVHTCRKIHDVQVDIDHVKKGLPIPLTHLAVKSRSREDLAKLTVTVQLDTCPMVVGAIKRIQSNTPMPVTYLGLKPLLQQSLEGVMVVLHIAQ